MAYGGLDLTLPVWILNPARHGDGAIVRQHVTIERIESGIVNVGDEYAFAQIIEHHDASGTTEPTEGFLVQLGPDACAGTEHQQPHRFAAAPQSHHEQPRPPVLTALRIAHHRASPVVDLGFFSRRGEDHRPCLWYLRSAQLVSESPNALIPTLEPVIGDQILPDRHGIAVSTETQLDDFAEGFTGASRERASPVFPGRTPQPHAKAGDHLYGRFCRLAAFGYSCTVRVGDHLYGRFCPASLPPSTGRPDLDPTGFQVSANGLSTYPRGLLDLS